jgi:hypothetical protein
MTHRRYGTSPGDGTLNIRFLTRDCKILCRAHYGSRAAARHLAADAAVQGLSRPASGGPPAPAGPAATPRVIPSASQPASAVAGRRARLASPVRPAGSGRGRARPGHRAPLRHHADGTRVRPTRACRAGRPGRPSRARPADRPQSGAGRPRPRLRAGASAAPAQHVPAPQATPLARPTSAQTASTAHSCGYSSTDGPSTLSAARFRLPAQAVGPAARLRHPGDVDGCGVLALAGAAAADDPHRRTARRAQRGPAGGPYGGIGQVRA